MMQAIILAAGYATRLKEKSAGSGEGAHANRRKADH